MASWIMPLPLRYYGPARAGARQRSRSFPGLAAVAAARPWGEGMLQSALSANAVAKGSVDVWLRRSWS